MQQAKAFRIGLTGGVGSGKSTVAAGLISLGAVGIDADAIARRLTAPGGAAMPAISQVFGARYVGADGALDRQAMRELAFGDPQARERLEAIVHPLVSRETERQALEALAAGAACLVFDVPLLVESGRRWRSQVDAVLVIDCSVQTQIERVVARSGWTREAVERVMAQQASRERRLAAADACLFNEGITLDALQQQVAQVWRHFGLSSRD